MSREEVSTVKERSLGSEQFNSYGCAEVRFDENANEHQVIQGQPLLSSEVSNEDLPAQFLQ